MRNKLNLQSSAKVQCLQIQVKSVSHFYSIITRSSKTWIKINGWKLDWKQLHKMFFTIFVH